MQQDRTLAASDLRAERLNHLARRGSALFKKVPVRVWRALAALLLVLWLAHSLARLFWLLVPEPQLPQAQVAPNALESARPPESARQVDIAELKSMQIFGSLDQEAASEIAEAGPAAGPRIEDEAVDTELRMTLQGVIDSSEAEGGRAIISSAKTQEIYARGDKLPEGQNVTLEKILPLRVILNNNGRYESLWLYQDKDFAGNRGNEPVPDTPSRSWEGDEDSLTPTEEPQTADEETAEEADVGPQTEVESQLEQASRSLSDVVSMSIHREDGQIMGYKIRPGRDREVFESLGLEAGDVVMAVNGTQLTSPQKVMELYRNMGDTSSASLLIRRGEQELNIDIDLE